MVTREKIQEDNEAQNTAFERAMRIEKAGPHDSMGWRGRLYVWLHLTVWHETVRRGGKAVWRALPRGEALKDLGIAAGILAAIATIVRTCRG